MRSVYAIEVSWIVYMFSFEASAAFSLFSVMTLTFFALRPTS